MDYYKVDAYDKNLDRFVIHDEISRGQLLEWLDDNCHRSPNGQIWWLNDDAAERNGLPYSSAGYIVEIHFLYDTK